MTKIAQKQPATRCRLLPEMKLSYNHCLSATAFSCAHMNKL